MFGYIRPLKGEMKVKEYEQFRAMYCGMCHTLRKHCGLLSRFLLSYDMCFAAMVLSGASACGNALCVKRCAVSPLRGRKCLCETEAMEKAADCTVILAYGKIGDGIRDEKGFKKFGYRVLSLVYKRKYKKSAVRLPVFAKACEESLRKLSEIEKDNTPSLDIPASVFASMLASLSALLPEEHRRAGEQLFFHLGRWIYIADAWDDVKEDMLSGNYNCVASRFCLANADEREKIDGFVAETLAQSARTAASAMELMQTGAWREIIANVLYLGLPSAAQSIREGLTKQRSLKHGSL